MKKILSLILITTIGIGLYGQRWERDDDDRYNNREIYTLFGNNRFQSGGYGGFGAGYTQIDGKDAITTSGRGAWIIGHGLAIGIAGTGFVNDFHYDTFLEEDVNLVGGYGGLLIEPIILGRSPVHISIPLIAGVGGIAYTRSSWTGNNWEYTDTWVEDSDTYLIFEPGVELEFNILRFFRIAAGISYRLTSDISLLEYDPGVIPSDVLNGYTAGITFKFGKF
jgi:hypothetical protein